MVMIFYQKPYDYVNIII